MFFRFKIDVNNKENVSGMVLYAKVDADIDARSIIKCNRVLWHLCYKFGFE